jgi:hypothetical protein
MKRLKVESFKRVEPGIVESLSGLVPKNEGRILITR